MSGWNDFDNEAPFSVTGSGSAVVAPPPDTPYVAPVEVAPTSNASANDSTSATSGSNTTNESPQQGREIRSAEGVRNEIATLVKQGYTLQQIQAAYSDIPVDKIGQEYEAAAYLNNPMNVTPGQSPEEISAKIEADKAAEFAKMQQGIFGIAGVAAGAAVVANADVNAVVGGGLPGTITGMDYVSSALNQIKVGEGESVSPLAANVMASGTPEMQVAMAGMDVSAPARSAGLGAVLSDLDGFTINKSQFASLSPAVMEQVNSAGRTMLSADVAGVGTLNNMTDTLDNSVSANAGIAGAGVAQQQPAGRTA